MAAGQTHDGQAAEPYFLIGIFRALRDAGFAASVRDYQDAVKLFAQLDRPFEDFVEIDTAGSGGIGDPPSVQLRTRDRHQVAWVLGVLLARSDSERQKIRTVVSRVLPPADFKQTVQLREILDTGSITTGARLEDPLPPRTFRDEEREERARQDARRKRKREKPEEPKKRKNRLTGPTAQKAPKKKTTVPTAEVDREPDVDSGMPVPRPTVESLMDTSSFSYDLASGYTYTWMLNTWRRLFIPRAVPDAHEVDTERTVDEAARVGLIAAPVMRTRRSNAARLLFLADIGQPTFPWQTTRDLLTETFVLEAPRYQSSALAFFKTAPGDRLFTNRALTRFLSAEETIRNHGHIPMLIWGEAGAAQTAPPRQVKRMEAFVQLLDQFTAAPIVWINPMPERYWHGSLMDEVQTVKNLIALEMNPESLIEAMDILRGQF
ncbi:hypothetical protein ACOTTU_24365 [Roseobacter sp. EG26]|uniref:hypothetical protein n=1 Tax=Roseobacter sp. EG26 TaxID=3412477 RepID=UPI003CE52941